MSLSISPQLFFDTPGLIIYLVKTFYEYLNGSYRDMCDSYIHNSFAAIVKDGFCGRACLA